MFLTFLKDGKPTSYIGAGFLVGPRHLLTAAHNVFNPEKNLGWATNIQVALGSGPDMIAPFGLYEVEKVYLPSAWLSTNTSSYLVDMALLILKDTDNIGERLGWVGLMSFDGQEDRIKNINIEISGYPKNSNDDTVPSDQGWYKKMVTHTNSMQIKVDRISHTVDTSGGQSGSALLVKSVDFLHILEPYAGGIHIQGFTDPNTHHSTNTALYFSKDVLKKIVGWIEHEKRYQRFREF